MNLPTHPSTTVRIINAAATIGGLSVVVKVASLFSTLIIASFFGTGDDMDAYLIAFLAPAFMITVISGSFSSAMVPIYVRVSNRGEPAESQELFSRILMLWIAAVSVAVGLLALSSSFVLPLLGSGFSAAKLLLTRNLLYLLLPVTLLKGLSVISASVLHAQNRFALAAVAPVSVPLATATITLLWPNAATRIYAVALGTVAGMSGELLVLGFGLTRRGVSLVPRWSRATDASRQVMSQWLPLVLGSMLVGGAPFVDRAMAAALAAGSVASFDYGTRLVNVAIEIAAHSLGVAVLPYFSRLADADGAVELRRLARTYSLWILLSMGVASAAFALFSEPLVALALERGEFTRSDTAAVARIQAVYALQMPFYVCAVLFARIISSLRANRVLILGSLLSLVANVILNYVFMRRWGVMGLALSTVCVYALSCGYSMIMAYRKLHAATER